MTGAKNAARSRAASSTVIVTGGNSGLGYHCARALAADGTWQVVIAARDSEKSARIAREIGTANGHANVEALPLDLGSLSAVRAFAPSFAARERPPLRALVCNAGVQLATLGARTVDGFEQTFGVNHLGHFLLVHLLLPRLAAPARIVVVSSATHDPARRSGMPAPRLSDATRMAHPETNPDLDTDAGVAARRAYATSKLCNLLFTHELARRIALRGTQIVANAFDPGFMPGTGLARDLGPLPRFLFRHLLAPLGAFLPSLATPKGAGAQLARLVTDPALAAATGRYYTRNGEARPSAESLDLRRATALWEQSAALVGLKSGETLPPVAEQHVR